MSDSDCIPAPITILVDFRQWYKCVASYTHQHLKDGSRHLLARQNVLKHVEYHMILYRAVSNS